MNHIDEKDALDWFENQLKNKLLFKFDVEETRDRWALNSYPMGQSILFALQTLKLFKAKRVVLEAMVEKLYPFLSQLQVSDYVEGITFKINPGENDTAQIDFEIVVSEPIGRYKKTLKRWFCTTVDDLKSDAGVDECIDLILYTFSQRPIYSTPSFSNQWKCSNLNDFNTHVPVEEEQVKEDLRCIFDEGGEISMRRFVLVAMTFNRESLFRQKYGKYRYYSLS